MFAATPASRRRQAGLTLIELMVVMLIIALATGALVLSLRDNAEGLLDKEAQRLSALLETARAQSRASGVAMRWRTVEGGFVLESLPPGLLMGATLRWLDPQTRATPGLLLLGPEPILSAQSVLLRNDANPSLGQTLSSNGLTAFSSSAAAPGSP